MPDLEKMITISGNNLSVRLNREQFEIIKEKAAEIQKLTGVTVNITGFYVDCT